MDRSPEKKDEASELGAFEAMSSNEPSKESDRPAAEAPPKVEVMCPNCGHPVEAGFKFCDWCGRPLPARPDEGIKAEPPRPESQQALPLAQEPETKPPITETKPPASETKAETTAPVPAGPPPIPTPPREQPIETKPETPPAPVPPPPPQPIESRPVTPPAPVPPPPPQPVRPPAETTKPTEPGTRPVPAPPPNIPPPRPPAVALRPVERTQPVPTIRKVEEPPPPMAPAGPAWRSVLSFVLHLIAAFVIGALVLTAVAVVVTLVTSGRIALLEIKGVPTAIAVASAVALFAVLRTSRRGGWVAWTAAALGILILAAAGAYLYRPVYLQDAQVRLERALNVWSGRDATAVEDFRNDLVSWNGTVAEYQRDVAAIVNKRISAQDFRGVAAPALQSLQETTVSMQTHSNAARNEKLRDALGTLAGVYNDQLTGLKLVSTGILSNDFNSLQSGDQQYKAGRERANRVFLEKVRPLLERAGIDADAFQQSLAQ